MKQTVESIMKSFQNSGKRHLVLTGSIGVGKTTRFLEIVKNFTTKEELPGITTYLVPGKCVMLRENNTLLEEKIGQFGERMTVVESGFDNLGIPAIKRAADSNSEWISIDELGFLESSHQEFHEAVFDVFEKKRVLAVLRKQNIPFLDTIRNRSDVCVIDIDEVPAKIGCVIMASGISQRFGSNKLLAEFEGKTLLQRIIDTTGEGLFAERVVVTRSEEVEKICKNQGVNVILHSFPGRNDTVRLGTEYMKAMDGIVFCPCDQPALKRESVEKMLHTPYVHDDMILRFAFGDNVGAPVFFGKAYFEELMHLPDKKGGSAVIKKHLEKVQLVFAQDEKELYDIDIPEDMNRFK